MKRSWTNLYQPVSLSVLTTESFCHPIKKRGKWPNPFSFVDKATWTLFIQSGRLARPDVLDFLLLVIRKYCASFVMFFISWRFNSFKPNFYFPIVLISVFVLTLCQFLNEEAMTASLVKSWGFLCSTLDAQTLSTAFQWEKHYLCGPLIKSFPLLVLQMSDRSIIKNILTRLLILPALVTLLIFDTGLSFLHGLYSLFPG